MNSIPDSFNNLLYNGSLGNSLSAMALRLAGDIQLSEVDFNHLSFGEKLLCYTLDYLIASKILDESRCLLCAALFGYDIITYGNELELLWKEGQENHFNVSRPFVLVYADKRYLSLWQHYKPEDKEYDLIDNVWIKQAVRNTLEGITWNIERIAIAELAKTTPT